MNKIKWKVETVLMLNPDTRNCDFELIFDYWYRYCWVELTEEQKARIKHWPSIHTIFRHRAYIQNEEWKFKGDDTTQYQRQSAEIDYRYNYWLSKEEKLQKFKELHDSFFKKFLSK